MYVLPAPQFADLNFKQFRDTFLMKPKDDKSNKRRIMSWEEYEQRAGVQARMLSQLGQPGVDVEAVLQRAQAELEQPQEQQVELGLKTDRAPERRLGQGAKRPLVAGKQQPSSVGTKAAAKTTQQQGQLLREQTHAPMGDRDLPLVYPNDPVDGKGDSTDLIEELVKEAGQEEVMVKPTQPVCDADPSLCGAGAGPAKTGKAAAVTQSPDGSPKARRSALEEELEQQQEEEEMRWWQQEKRRRERLLQTVPASVVGAGGA